MRVLLLDNNSKELCDLLTEQGHEVVRPTSGLDAVERYLAAQRDAKQPCFDVVVGDPAFERGRPYAAIATLDQAASIIFTNRVPKESYYLRLHSLIDNQRWRLLDDNCPPTHKLMLIQEAYLERMARKARLDARDAVATHARAGRAYPPRNA